MNDAATREKRHSLLDVPPDHVRQQLARMLASNAFSSAPILSRLLRHLVEHSLAGGADQLKEYSLGVDVFDRGTSFDPRTDTIVRVQVRRLRGRLKDYYEAGGLSDPVIVTIPTGHYNPLFRWRSACTEPHPVALCFDAPPAPQAGTQRVLPTAGRLPIPRTPLIGRDQELAAVTRSLQDPAVRLVTLLGSGGSGKTRLALEAARTLAGQFPGGVSFLALAPLRDADAVTTTIMHTLGLRDSGGKTVQDALREHVNATIVEPTLLVFDNFEHVLATTPLVATMLEASPAVKVLATSREALKVYGEHEFPVPPLALPDRAASFEAIEQNAAVRLFVQRAIAIQPGFALTHANAATIVEICRRLDGLPLTIELAAARSKMFGVDAILARLDRALDFLTGGARDLPQRQQRLRDMIDWSHALLTPAEQTLFRRLAVFAGGWTLEGVEAVCNAYQDLAIDSIDGLSSLVDKSLVQPQVATLSGEARFTMLETLREYAHEQLRASRDDIPMRKAHAAYCLVLAEEGNPQLTNAERAGWLARCDQEHDNFHTALDWLIAELRYEWALRLVVSLFGYWERREYLLEGRQRLETVVALRGTTPANADYARAITYIAALGGLNGDFHSALELHQQSLAVFRELGDRKGQAAALNSLGTCSAFHGRHADARRYLERALVVCQDIGSQPEIAATLSNLAGALRQAGELEDARIVLQRAHALFHALGDELASTWSINQMGDIASDRGDHAEAQRLYKEAFDRFTRLGDLWGVARSATDLAHVTCDEGDYSATHALLADALGHLITLDYKRGIARVLEGFAYLAQSQREYVRAVTLMGAAEGVRRDYNAVPRPAEKARLERQLRPAWHALGSEKAQSCVNAGRRLGLDVAIRYAIDGDLDTTIRS